MNDLNLGSGYKLKFFGWHPDRKVNPQYEGLEDLEVAGGLLTCPHGQSAIHFGIPETHRHIFSGVNWEVVSWEPLTLDPSIASRNCGCHGFIREGKWQSA